MEEKIYTINLKREFIKDSRYKKSNRASREVRRFLEKHMKSDEVKIGSNINELIWKRGNQSPPAKIKIKAVKSDDGKVTAELFGVEIEKPEKMKEEAKTGKKEEKTKKGPKAEKKSKKPTKKKK